MSYDAGAGYGFADGVPVDPISPGSTLLVAGPAFSRSEDLALSMIADGDAVSDGMLFVSTTMTCRKLLEVCRGTRPSLDTSRVGVLDCSGQDIGQSELGSRTKYVSTPSDLTGMGMKFSALYESLYGDVEGGRIRSGLISLSSLSMYVDLRTLFQFARTLSGRIDSAGGLGLFTIDPTTHDTRTVNTLSQVADGRIEVREADGDADGELRVRGLRDHPDGWRTFSLP